MHSNISLLVIHVSFPLILGVGKSSLLHRYVDSKFVENYKVTINIEHATKEIVYDNKKIVLRLWDTVFIL